MNLRLGLSLSTLLGATFTPLSLNPSAWFFAENLATASGGSTAPTTLGDPVGQATDLSGNARHAVQATAGKQPQYDPTGINNSPAIKFPGDAARSLTTGAFGGALSQPNTVFCVFRTVDKSTQRNIYDGAASGGRNLLWVNGTGKQVGAYAGSAAYDYAAAEVGTYLYTVQYNGTSSTMRRNGAAIPKSLDFSTQAMGGVTLGADNAGTGSKFQGWIREYIAFNALLTTAQIQQVEAFLAARSGVTLYPNTTTGAIGGNNWYLLVPPLYAGGTRKCVQYHHGRAEAVTAPLFTEAAMVPMIQALLTAGFFVCGTDTASQTDWGNQAARDAHAALAQLLRGRETFSKWIFWGRSMGGLTSQGGVADSRYGGVDGFYGTYPVCDLDAMYANNAGTFAAEILTAYGANAGNYASRTAGFRVIDDAAANWSGKPWRATASASDTVVGKTANADAMSTHVSGQASENTVVATAGDHGDASNFDSTIQADIVSFMGRC